MAADTEKTSLSPSTSMEVGTWLSNSAMRLLSLFIRLKAGLSWNL